MRGPCNDQAAGGARIIRAPRGGFSLLELTVVIALIGILAAVGIGRYGRGTLGNLGAEADARRVALDLLQAQRRAIATGDNHLLQFSSTGYSLLRRVGGSTVAFDSVREFGPNVTVTASHANCEYQFDGSALAGYTITLAGPDRSWQVSVVAATGTARVVEL